jgi:hypothetical protein
MGTFFGELRALAIAHISIIVADCDACYGRADYDSYCGRAQATAITQRRYRRQLRRLRPRQRPYVYDESDVHTGIKGLECPE